VSNPFTRVPCGDFQVRFAGPGLSQYELPLSNITEDDTRNLDWIHSMLARAFEAGKEERSRELRALLGVHERR
jgi:hypothetical protein